MAEWFLLWKLLLVSQKTFNKFIPQTLRITNRWLYKGHSSKLSWSFLAANTWPTYVFSAKTQQRPAFGAAQRLCTCCLLELFFKNAQSFLPIIYFHSMTIPILKVKIVFCFCASTLFFNRERKSFRIISSIGPVLNINSVVLSGTLTQRVNIIAVTLALSWGFQNNFPSKTILLCSEKSENVQGVS